MAKKSSPKASAAKPAAKVSAKATTTSSPVRNTPIPKTASIAAKAAPVAAVAKVFTHDDIARKAFEIFASPRCGDQLHNWLAAERELRGV